MSKAQNDKRMEEILEMYEHNSLGLDDTFQFKCRGCGKCCKNREDIILTTRDLYNIASHLGRSTEYIFDRYCEVYIGDNSRLPVIRLKPSGPDKVCPLLRDRHCIVHTVKPVVCALYPLGRGASIEKTDNGAKMPERIEPRYFVQPITCGTADQTHTVRGWLEQFGLPVEDEFYSQWTEATSMIGELLRNLEQIKVVEKKTMNLFWEATFFSLYINYDVSLELIPQFRENIAKLMLLLCSVEAVAAKVFGGASDGN